MIKKIEFHDINNIDQFQNVIKKMNETIDIVNEVSPCSKLAESLYNGHIFRKRMEAIEMTGCDCFRETQLTAEIIQDKLDSGMTEEEIWTELNEK